MDKHLIPAFFLIGSLSICPGFGQSLHPQGVFSGIHLSASPRLAYTLGELAVLQFPGPGGPSIQHGFMASVLAPFTVTSQHTVSGWDAVFQLYPNPVSDWLTLKRSEQSVSPLNIFIYEAQGRAIRRDDWPEGQSEMILPLWHIPSGLYLITITHPSGVHLHTFQLVKP